MKYKALILVFYLMGMMMLPCSDAYNECRPEQNLQSKVKSSTEHSHGTDANDNCSPFCNCSCCHTTIDNKFLAKKEEEPKAILTEKKYLFTNQRFVSNYYGSIWQPPKLNG
ncbi:MAG: hypothetical protein REI64_01565 [Pedobacter sp.]|uniref:DUF6660 family protein n=1 Tax=Pedobacter sp. TaxID=1411316 RepID=UPI0028084D4F|nr:DUF6660 family protein [Pedobacter sp.]MDQ8003454.1 hypothetical protein [Pedobacter sp.]